MSDNFPAICAIRLDLYRDAWGPKKSILTFGTARIVSLVLIWKIETTKKLCWKNMFSNITQQEQSAESSLVS